MWKIEISVHVLFQTRVPMAHPDRRDQTPNHRSRALKNRNALLVPPGHPVPRGRPDLQVVPVRTASPVLTVMANRVSPAPRDPPEMPARKVSKTDIYKSVRSNVFYASQLIPRDDDCHALDISRTRAIS